MSARRDPVARRSEARSSGQALVEFALTIPLFLLLMLAIIDMGRMLVTSVSLANGVRELSRSLSVSSNTNSTVIASFNNLTLFLGSVNPATDYVTMTVTDTVGNITTASCALPLTAACIPPSRLNAGDGYVDVSASYNFQYNPLFQTVLGGVVYVSFTKPYTVLTTSTRAYLE